MRHPCLPDRITTLATAECSVNSNDNKCLFPWLASFRGYWWTTRSEQLKCAPLCCKLHLQRWDGLIQWSNTINKFQGKVFRYKNSNTVARLSWTPYEVEGTHCMASWVLVTSPIISLSSPCFCIQSYIRDFQSKNQVIRFHRESHKLWNPPSLCCNPLIQVGALALASGVETWYGYWYPVLTRTCKTIHNDLSWKIEKHKKGTFIFNFKMCQK